MVNTGESTTTTPLASSLPEVSIEFDTFTTLDPVSIDELATTGGRFCNFSINITGVKLSLAVATFSRVFSYVLNLVNSDVNPVTGVNSSVIPNIIGALGTKPTGSCTIQVDKTQLISTVTLAFSGGNVRLDYLDEYFDRSLTYLTEALQGDLNPDE